MRVHVRLVRMKSNSYPPRVVNPPNINNYPIPFYIGSYEELVFPKIESAQIFSLTERSVRPCPPHAAARHTVAMHFIVPPRNG